jgi:chromosome segregation ATPase
LAIDSELLKTERDRLRDSLRETEASVRKVESELKALRQREIQTKREIEALSTLIEIKDQRDTKNESTAGATTS